MSPAPVLPLRRPAAKMTLETQCMRGPPRATDAVAISWASQLHGLNEAFHTSSLVDGGVIQVSRTVLPYVSEH